MRPALLFPVLIALTTVTAGDGHAKTVKVKPGGALSTIQSGLNAASAGDTVLVFPGVYRETLFVPAALSGTTLKGKGGAKKVILDAHPVGGGAGGPGVVVEASGFTIEGLTIRNAKGTIIIYGEGVMIDAPDVTIRKSVFIGNDARAVTATPGSSGLVVDGCTAYGCGFDGVAGTILKKTKVFGLPQNKGSSLDVGDDGQVIECLIESGGGITTDERCLVKKCVVRNSTDAGIEVQEGSEVRGCLVENSSSSGIVALGDDCDIVDNEVRIASTGIACLDDRAFCSGNVVREARARGMLFLGDDITVLDNDVDVVRGFGGTTPIGIELTHSKQGLVVGNVVRRVNGPGITIEQNSTGVTFRKNVVRECLEEGFLLAGTGHVLEENQARDGYRHGFAIDGSGHALTDNVARENLKDGFHVVDVATGITLDGNDAKKNGGEGLDNAAADTVARKNVLTGNRIDVANDGAFATFEQNVFATGGPGTTPEVD